MTSASGVWEELWADRPIELYWKMLGQVQAAAQKLPHQHLRGISTGEREEITDLFGAVDLFDATQIELPPTLADWPEKSEEKSGFKLQLKLGGRERQLKEVLITKPDGNDNDYFEDLLDLRGEDRSEKDRSKTSQSDREAGALYLFDCGYWSINTYRRITESGDFFARQAPRQYQAGDRLRAARSGQGGRPGGQCGRLSSIIRPLRPT